MEKLIQILKSRSMNGYFVKTKEQAKNKALELIPRNSIVGFGGSATLQEIGLLDELRQRKDIKLYDRISAKAKDMPKLNIDSLSADIFLSGTNSITEKGQLVNVDGVGNRVAAIIFGPKKVIIIAGKNKVTKDIDSALDRIKKVALVKNMERMKKFGRKDWNEENMWGQVSIIERQRDPNRMHVIIVDEELGF